MNALVRRRLDMATRVRDFLRAHNDVVGEGPGLARLEELIQRADGLVAKQRAGFAATRSATMQRENIRDTLQTALLKYLKAVSATVEKENPDLAAQFRLPHRNVSHRTFLAAVQGVLAKATEQKDLLVSHGMRASLLDDLAKSLGLFEQTLEASSTGRREHVGASADLGAVATDIVEQVRVLDGLMQYRFRENADLMGEWSSARNVLGPVRSKVQPQAPAEGGQTPKAA